MVFLPSDDAAYITGRTISVSGGHHARMTTRWRRVDALSAARARDARRCCARTRAVNVGLDPATHRSYEKDGFEGNARGQPAHQGGTLS
jgi:hypothetical protein